MGEITQGHNPKDKTVTPENVRNDSNIKFMENLVNQLVGLLHGFGTEPDAGKGNEDESVEDFPEPCSPMSALFIR